MERLRQLPQIKEVLQARIGHIKLDHRLKFLGDGALRCVAKQMRLPEIQQLRIFNLHRPWDNDITESEIKLQRQMRISQSPINTNPDAVILLIECDRLTLYALRVKAHTVIRNFYRQALPDDFDKVIDRFWSAPQHINVHRRPSQ